MPVAGSVRIVCENCGGGSSVRVACRQCAGNMSTACVCSGPGTCRNIGIGAAAFGGVKIDRVHEDTRKQQLLQPTKDFETIYS